MCGGRHRGSEKVHGSSYVKYNLWDPICPGHPHEAGGCGGYHSGEGFILELRFFKYKRVYGEVKLDVAFGVVLPGWRKDCVGLA